MCAGIFTGDTSTTLIPSALGATTGPITGGGSATGGTSVPSAGGGVPTVSVPPLDPPLPGELGGRTAGGATGGVVTLRFAPALNDDFPYSSAPTSGASPEYPSVYGDAFAPSSIAGELDFSVKSPPEALLNFASVPSYRLRK